MEELRNSISVLIFPARVGMNPLTVLLWPGLRNFPRASGDEP